MNKKHRWWCESFNGIIEGVDTLKYESEQDFIKENNDKPEFKAALIDGDFYGPDQLEALAAMKSKDEIIGDILGLLMAPITNVVGGLQAQGSNLVGAVKTIAEKGEN